MKKCERERHKLRKRCNLSAKAAEIKCNPDFRRELEELKQKYPYNTTPPYFPYLSQEQVEFLKSKGFKIEKNAVKDLKAVIREWAQSPKIILGEFIPVVFKDGEKLIRNEPLEAWIDFCIRWGIMINRLIPAGDVVCEDIIVIGEARCGDMPIAPYGVKYEPSVHIGSVTSRELRRIIEPEMAELNELHRGRVKLSKRAVISKYLRLIKSPKHNRKSAVTLIANEYGVSCSTIDRIVPPLAG